MSTPSKSKSHAASDTSKVVFPTLDEIKLALPDEVFVASTSLSLLYMLRTVVLAFVLGASLWFARSNGYDLSNTVGVLLSVAYVLAQGTVFWGAFTIGHDAGHGSFSRHPILNWIVGNALHSAILTPYEPWRMSHRSHHKNTGNIEKDEIFYPNASVVQKLTTQSLGLGWLFYLILGNVPKRRNYSAYFSAEFAQQWGPLAVSFLSLLGVVGAIVAAGLSFGPATVALYYGAPVLVFGTWLVIVTFLHHNDEDTPWYTDDSWDYVKGNLSSVDRDYGALVNEVSHYINLHQIHHLFPIIPHYHLAKATDAFKAAFPHLYRVRKGFFVVDFAKAVRDWFLYGDGASDVSDTFSFASAKKLS